MTEDKKLYAGVDWYQREIMNISLVETSQNDGKISYRLIASVSLDDSYKSLGSLKVALIDILNNSIRK